MLKQTVFFYFITSEVELKNKLNIIPKRFYLCSITTWMYLHSFYLFKFGNRSSNSSSPKSFDLIPPVVLDILMRCLIGNYKNNAFSFSVKQYLVVKHNGPIAQLWRGGLTRQISPKTVAGPFYYAEQNGCLKFWLDVFGKWISSKERLLALQSLFALKKDTRTFNFESN